MSPGKSHTGILFIKRKTSNLDGSTLEILADDSQQLGVRLLESQKLLHWDGTRLSR
jgi:hypothetical protein